MTDRIEIERLLGELYAATADPRPSSDQLEAIVARTSSIRPWPAWRAALGGGGSAVAALPIRWRPGVLVLLALLVALAVAAVAGLLPVGQSQPARVALPTEDNRPSTTSSPLASIDDSRCGIDQAADRGGVLDQREWPGPLSVPGVSTTVRPGALAGWTAEGSGFDIVLVDPQTGALTRLTHFEKGSSKESTTGWSPDGTALALSWFDESTPTCSDLFIASGGLVVRPYPSTVHDQSEGFAWAPDSSRIATVRFQSDDTSGPPREAVWLLTRDGSAPRTIGNPCAGCAITQVAWSRGGTWIAAPYETLTPDQLQTAGSGIAFYDMAGGRWHRVSVSSTTVLGLSFLGWADDGSVLVDLSGADGRDTIARISAVGSGDPQAVPHQSAGAAAGAAALSPDGTTIASITEAGSGTKVQDVVAILDLSTGAERVLWSGPPGALVASVIWAPDGSAVAITVDPTDPAVPTQAAGLWIVQSNGLGTRHVTSAPIEVVAWQPAWQ